VRKPTASESTLILGSVGAVVLWLLGDTTTAIIVLVVEAIAWAAIHAFAPSRKE